MSYNQKRQHVEGILKGYHIRWYGNPTQKEMTTIYEIFRQPVPTSDQCDTPLEWLYYAVCRDVKGDCAEAKILYEKIYNQYSLSAAAVNIAHLYEQEKDYPSAISWYKKAIRDGNATAINNLGHLHDCLNNNNKAMKYYKIAMDNGNEVAIRNLRSIFTKLFDGKTPLTSEVIHVLRNTNLDELNLISHEIKLFKQYL